MNKNTAFLITIGLIGFLSSNLQATGGDIFSTKPPCTKDSDCGTGGVCKNGECKTHVLKSVEDLT